MKRDFQQLPSQATPMPYAVSCLADLPGSLQEAARRSVNPGEALPSICVFPGRTHLKDMYRWENVPGQALLFTDKSVLHLQAPLSPDQAATTVCLPATDLLYARLSLILMVGRLELVDQSLSRMVVDFNAAGFNIIQPGLQHLLAAASRKNINPAPQADPEVDRTEALLEQLGGLSFKFRNGLALYGLLPGERLLGCVFQPGLRGRHWRLFPYKVSETTLLVLTDQQLIIVEEQSRSRFPAYGWIFTFHPRHAVEKIAMTPSLPWQELTIGLKRLAGLNNDRNILLEAPNALAWRALWSQFGDLPIPSI